MLKKYRKFFSVVLICAVLMSMFITPLKAIDVGMDNAEIQMDSIVQPRWTNVYVTDITLGHNDGKIDISITMSGYSGTTFSNGTIVLQKVNGSSLSLIKTWRNLSSDSRDFEFTDNSKSYTSGTYRVAITITATRNGVSETITLDEESTYS